MTEEQDSFQLMLKELYYLIGQLGQLDKSIILLYLEEKSYEEISEITGLTVTNVATKAESHQGEVKKDEEETNKKN